MSDATDTPPLPDVVPGAGHPQVGATHPAGAGRPSRVDPRGPRFGAGITSVLLLATLTLDLQGLRTPATVALGVVVALFAWGALAGVGRHPWGWVFRRFVRPRLAPPEHLEDTAPPTFAQLVGFLITGTGLILALIGVPHAVTVAAALAFVAAFLNAVFAFCLGCQLHVLLVRAGVIGRREPRAA